MTNNHSLADMSKCRFCRIGAGEARFDYDNVVLETKDYFAVASVGGFVEGWTLISAKRHVLNLSNDYKVAAFQDFTAEVADAVSSIYGDLVVFEHGVNRAGSLTGCGTDHAHLHLVPFSGDFVSKVMAFDPLRDWHVMHASEIEAASNGREYLMMATSLEDLATSSHVSIVDQPTSQFFRKVLASNLGLSDQSDYRLFPFVDRAISTMRKVATQVNDRQTA